MLPSAEQNQMARLAGSEIIHCGAAHMAMLSIPEKVVEVIECVVNT